VNIYGNQDAPGAFHAIGRGWWLPALRWRPAQRCLGCAELVYDEWVQGSNIIARGERASLPATFRFDAAAPKAVILRPEFALRLSCVVGTFWVTSGDDRADHVLSAGQSIWVPGTGTVDILARHCGLVQVGKPSHSSSKEPRERNGTNSFGTIV
jgi:hypothetical protein